MPDEQRLTVRDEFARSVEHSIKKECRRVQHAFLLLIWNRAVLCALVGWAIGIQFTDKCALTFESSSTGYRLIVSKSLAEGSRELDGCSGQGRLERPRAVERGSSVALEVQPFSLYRSR